MLILFQNEDYNQVVSPLLLVAKLHEKNSATHSFTDICMPVQ